MRAPLRPRDLIAVVLVAAFGLAASGTHVVRSGETLSGIAARNGTTIDALVDANGIANPNLIRAGQSLTIPGGDRDAGSSGSSGANEYVVQRGDTLAGIARKFGTTVAAIAQANGIANPNLIRAGARLAIGSGAPSAPSADRGSSTPSGSAGLPGQRHTVRPGDTIAGIASRYGISQADFVRWNGLVDGKLYATTRLALYDPGVLPSASEVGATRTHTVARGEALSTIARRYGTTSSAIAKASGISDRDLIYVGQQLTIPGGGAGGAAFRCPVPGGSFFNDWGFPRSGGRSHAGNDIFAPRGTPVHAPTSGWVDIATGTIGGHQFRLTGGDGTLWYGSHLDRFGKSGKVTAGDVIGYVGDSGNARGGRPHLHFEIHPGREAVNPFPLLRSIC